MDFWHDKTVLENQRLVYHIVNQMGYNRSFNEYDDLISVGTIGLIKATLTFDKSKNIKFSSYACVCIQNEILMYLRKFKNNIQCVSLENSASNFENSITLLEKISNSSSSFTDKVIDKIVFAYFVEIILNYFNGRKRLVLLYCISNTTQEEISTKLGISQSYISRLKDKLIKKVRILLDSQISYKKNFSFSIHNNYYKISFSLESIPNFELILSDYLKKTTISERKTKYKIVQNEELFSIIVPAEPNSLYLIAELIKAIDDYCKN